MPKGVVQVAVVGAINVGAAVIFPAFNDFLSGAFEIPDAVAQELAATGDPVRATAAGVRTAAGVVTAAITVIADSVVTAVSNTRAAAAQPVPGVTANRRVPTQSSTTTTPPSRTMATTPPSRTMVGLPHPVTTKGATPHANAAPGISHLFRNIASNVRQTTRGVTTRAGQRHHRTASS
jgi:hypothetical protein